MDWISFASGSLFIIVLELSIFAISIIVELMKIIKEKKNGKSDNNSNQSNQ